MGQTPYPKSGLHSCALHVSPVPANPASRCTFAPASTLGQTLTSTDRNGTVHTLAYDVLGRITTDTVTTLGTNINGAIRRVETAYDSQGNAYLLTNYDATTSGNIVNQVQLDFNGLGQLVTEFQSNSGAVNTGSSPKVQYAYSEMASGVNHSRPTSMTYPNSRVIDFNYGVALDDSISRLSALKDGATTLESYDYLGLGTVVKRGHAQSGVDLTYIKASGEGNGDAGDQYTGLDRFGRVVDQRWRTSSVEKDRYQYGYDRNGNRLYRDNLVNTALGELYAYDNLNQLSSFDRGTLNGSKNGLTGAASRSQDWDYDALGNFDSVTTDGGSAVTRTHNKQNEITAVSGATSPVFDAAGNMTTDETGKQYVYDAWNRLVTVKNSGGTTIASYEYDGLTRRIQETASGVTTDLYYSALWQVIEERVSGAATKSYVWSPVYVDAMVARDRDTDANGSLDERLYVMHDANFNVTGLVNTSGTVVERYTYDPYGVATVRDGSWTAGSTAYVWQYLHQGGRLSGQSGLYAFRYREYSPTLGRWVTVDLLQYLGNTNNLYLYESNSSISRLDYIGLADYYPTPPKEDPKKTYDEIFDKYWGYYSKVLTDAGYGKACCGKIKETFQKGCVGITLAYLGLINNEKPKLDNCYKTFKEAADYADKMIKNNTCGAKGKPPALFSVRFNDLGRPQDFVADPKTGRVDMSKWTWKAKPGFVNFDFGLWMKDINRFMHANHCDPGPNCSLKDRMRVYQSNYAEYTKPLKDFNQIVFCVECRKGISK